MDEELDFTKLKYALYARKSTEDPERQVRSIDDQVDECEKLAQRLGLHVITPYIKETKSAKKPGQRPQFTQMLKDIRAGKYDAILAWNPDRLARNMKEGGEIIDMIDDEILKDLKFATHHFTKDANGKMLLGISFVLSKQYSDKLSQDVRRGVRKGFEEGKALNSKHGYIRDERGLQIPDGKNFDLISEAWQMRKTGTSLEVITEHLNNHGYGKLVKKTGQLVQMDKRILSKIFKDPFYYGLLIQAKQTVDLRELYDFKSAITEQEYLEVQALSNRAYIPKTGKRFTFYPFKGMILCSFCGKAMVVGPSKSRRGERYLYYRCDSKFCSRKKKSIRSKVILDWIYDFLKDGLNFTEKDYNDYYEGITKLTDDKRAEIQIDIHSLQGQLKGICKEIDERSLGIIKLPETSPVRQSNEKKVASLSQQENTIERSIEALKKQLGNPEQEKLSLEQFLNLSENASVVVQSANAVIKDTICRYIFLNLSVDEEKVLSYQSKEPFATLIKQRQQHPGRGERT